MHIGTSSLVAGALVAQVPGPALGAWVALALALAAGASLAAAAAVARIRRRLVPVKVRKQ